MMKRIIAFWLLLYAGFLCLGQQESRSAGWLPLAGAGGGGGGYSGPGDIVPGALAWYGMRAYSAAKAATAPYPAFDITDVNALNPATINILSTGYLDEATLNTYIIAHGIPYFVKFYDQSGHGLDLVPTGNLQGVRISQNAIGTNSAFAFPSGIEGMINSTGFGALPQPFTISAVYERTTVTTYGDIFTDSAGNGFLGDMSADKILLYNGGSVTSTAAATDNAFHALQTVFNDAVQSLAYIDGVNTNVTMGSTIGWAAGNIDLGGGVRQPPVSKMMEVGIWGSAFSSGNRTNMNSNQHTKWGF